MLRSQTKELSFYGIYYCNFGTFVLNVREGTGLRIVFTLHANSCIEYEVSQRESLKTMHIAMLFYIEFQRKGYEKKRSD